MKLELWIRDTGERIVSTFLAGVATWLLALDAFPDATWVESLVAAVFPPVIVLVMTALPSLNYTGPVWWKDALTRVVRSFLQGFLGALAASVTLFDVTVWQAAAVAGGYAAIATVKTIIARFKPGTVTPASFAFAGQAG